MADLYRWRYTALHDLPAVASEARFHTANAGFAHPFQFVDVDDLNGVGESSVPPLHRPERTPHGTPPSHPMGAERMSLATAVAAALTAVYVASLHLSADAVLHPEPRRG
jgi:hypothetical protein